MTSRPAKTGDTVAAQSGGAGFWCAAAIGIAVMAFGVYGIVTHARGTHPPAFVVWFVGADLVHDLLVAPAVLLVGAIAARAVPARWWPPVRAGLIASAVVLVVGWAPLRGYGRATAAGNGSVQPLDYATAVPTVLAVVWGAVACWLAWRARRRAHRPVDDHRP
jgi:hypothetical protein